MRKRVAFGFLVVGVLLVGFLIWVHPGRAQSDDEPSELETRLGLVEVRIEEFEELVTDATEEVLRIGGVVGEVEVAVTRVEDRILDLERELAEKGDCCPAWRSTENGLGCGDGSVATVFTTDGADREFQRVRFFWKNEGTCTAIITITGAPLLVPKQIALDPGGSKYVEVFIPTNAVATASCGAQGESCDFTVSEFSIRPRNPLSR